MIRSANPRQRCANASAFAGAAALALHELGQPRAAFAAGLLGVALFATFLALMFRSVRR